jgi:hypothetical protein
VEVWRQCRAKKKKRGEIWACERIKEVKEGSWTCCRTKKRHGQAGAAAGGRRHAWRLRATAARRGGVGKSHQGSGEQWAGELEGQVVRLGWRGAAGSPGDHRRAGGGRRSSETEKEGREEDDGDLFAIFQKF